jgi:hypothetical protein
MGKPFSLASMSADQLSTYRALRASISAARADYHAALASKASASARHAAERRCTAAMAAMQAFQASL